MISIPLLCVVLYNYALAYNHVFITLNNMWVFSGYTCFLSHIIDPIPLSLLSYQHTCKIHANERYLHIIKDAEFVYQCIVK